MDVVREQVVGLGGIVTFRTERGKGSSFTFRVPLVSAVNILDALVVRSGKYHFAFPIANVITTMSVPKEQIHTTLEKGAMVKYLDHLLPLHSLNYLLEKGEEGDTGGAVPVLVIDHKGMSVALRISEFFSPQKLVIIPFAGTLNVVGLSGTTILGGRKLGFIIDVPSLIDRAMGRRGVRAARKAEAAAIAPRMTREITATQEAAEKAPPPVRREAKEEVKAEDVAAATREFIVEIEKLLPTLNEALFALESDTRNMDHVNKAFRMYHTIKGNFIMIGLAKGGATVHSVESVLDRVRSKKVEMTPEVMDILMDGVAYIEEVVRQSKAGAWQDAESSSILEQCAKILPEEKAELKAAVDVATTEVRLSHEASYRSIQYKKLRTPSYMCYIEFDPGQQPAFLVACLIYKRVSEVGDVLGTVPPLVDIERGVMDGKVKLLFASAMDAGKLEEALVHTLTSHYGAQVVRFSRFE